MWKIGVNNFNKQLRTADNCGPPAWELGEVLTTSVRENNQEIILSEMSPPEKNNPEVKYSPTRIYGV